MRKLLLKILAFLRVRAISAGLEVSDQVVRLVYFDGRSWQLHAVRLQPGVLSGGMIVNRAGFDEALLELRKQVVGRRRRSIGVVVCLSSTEVYTQTFSLPAVRGKGLEEAVELNLAMVAPAGGTDTTYSDWQSLGVDNESAQAKILAAFIGRKEADGMADELFDHGFPPGAFESRALALSRVLRMKGAGIDIGKSYLFVNIDNVGVDFLVIAGGLLSFEHAEQWRDVVNERGEIAMARFVAAVTAGVRQVMNFYAQHWKEPLSGIILSTPAYFDEAEEAIREAVGAIPIVRLTLEMGQPISPEWLAALGASMRNSGDSVKSEREVNLLGAPSEDRFRAEQMADFLRFWRIAVPVALGLLLATFGTADFYLQSLKGSIESRSDFNVGTAMQAEVGPLGAAAQSFNSLVALTATAEGNINPKAPLLGAISAAAAANHVTVSELSFQAFGATERLSGAAVNESDIVAFKNALAAIPGVTNVVLPLTNVQTIGNSISFTITFTAEQSP